MITLIHTSEFALAFKPLAWGVFFMSEAGMVSVQFGPFVLEVW